MPRAGGESDKLGNQYEGAWTVGRLLDVAEGKFESLTVEPLEDGLGMEFILKHIDGAREFHSAKRQRSEGEWSLAVLSRPGKNTSRSVLGDMQNKIALADCNRSCFVSSTGANDLRELSEMASRRGSFAQFEAELKSRSAIAREFENRLVKLCSGDREQAYELLKRLRVVLVDAKTLTEQVDRHIAHLVYRADSDNFEESDVRLQLGDFILQQLGNDLRSETVWDYLKQFGYLKRDWATEPTIREAVATANKDYQRVVESELVNDERLTRTEAQDIAREVTSNGGSKVVLVSAPAGVGKSCVITQVLDLIEAQDVPSLVVRMDRHGSAVRTRDIGVQMGLPKSPAVVLAGLANGGPSVLLIDQLDAVSQVSGRYPNLWEVFDALHRETNDYPNMRVVIVCRDFDLEHDHRLRRLRDSKIVRRIPIDRLSIQEVENAVTLAQKGHCHISEKEKELLRTPLHLFLYLTGSGVSESAVSFQSISDLFDHYWVRKQRKVSERLEHKSDWTEALRHVCQVMSDSMTLYVPEVLLDEWPETAKAMLTEHVLIKDGKQVRFFHESFFDYAFARGFCATGQSLVSFLRSSEQHLFRRSQVRQILSFLRDQNPEEYLTQLGALLNADDIRFHLKRVVLSWVGSLTTPTAEEWSIVGALFQADDLGRFAEAAVRNSLPWFDLLHGRGVIASWLASSEKAVVDRGYWSLTMDRVAKERADEVALLLCPYTNEGPAWADRFRSFFRFGFARFTPRIQELYLQLFRDGLFDRTEDNEISWWDQMREVVNEQPRFVHQVFLIWLDRKIQALRERNADERQYLGGWLKSEDRGQSSLPILRSLRIDDPFAFASSVLPRVEEILSLTTVSHETRLSSSAVWSVSLNYMPMQTADAILYELKQALETLSISGSCDLQIGTTEQLNSPLDVMSDLLIQYWSANPSRFANACFEYLSADSRRLKLGYFTEGQCNGAGAIARMAIQRCAASASPQMRIQLQNAIRTASFYQDPEYDQKHERLLLESFGDRHLSADGCQRLSHLRSKFRDQNIAIPPRYEDSRAGFVVSPIPTHELMAFTDDQILDAMGRVDYGWDDISNPAHRFGEGTAVELSRELGTMARLDRDRFTALVLKMNDSIRAEYFEQILSGLCGQGDLKDDEKRADLEKFGLISTEAILGVIRRIHSLPDRPCGRSICDAIVRLSDRTLPEDVFDIIRYYATEDSDPTSDQWVFSQCKDGKQFASTAFMSGINSVRGHAAMAIQSLLIGDFLRSVILIPIIREMVQDHSLSVRTCVIASLLPILNHNRDEAVALFCQVCSGAELIIGCDPFDRFVRYVASTHYSQVQSVLIGGLESESDESITSSSVAICLAAFTNEDARSDAFKVRTGTESMRKAAAKVYATNVGDETVGSQCIEFLKVMFSDESEEVRSQASFCFSNLDDQDLRHFLPLIRSYVESVSFPSHHDHLLRCLERSTCQLPEITVELAKKFVAVAGERVEHSTRIEVINSQDVSNLVVRLYTQSSDECLQRTCLDLIDDMERMAFYGIDKQLAEYDR